MANNYYQGGADFLPTEKVQKFYYLLNRYNYPIRVTYDGEAIMVPPRAKKGQLKIEFLSKLASLPKGIFAVGE